MAAALELVLVAVEGGVLVEVDGEVAVAALLLIAVEVVEVEDGTPVLVLRNVLAVTSWTNVLTLVEVVGCALAGCGGGGRCCGGTQCGAWRR